MNKSFYREKRIPKNGGTRLLEIPCDPLKAIQRDYYDKELLNGVGPGPYAFGCVKGRSPEQMAFRHAGRRRGTVVVFDLAHAFHSVRPRHIEQALKFEKFTQKEISERMAIPSWVENADFSQYRYPFGMKNICFVEGGKGCPRAAMGAPSSPYLLNLALKRMDFSSVKALKVVGADVHYSRYVDDIVISSWSDQIQSITKKVLLPMFGDYGFPINMRKYRVQRNRSNRQVVLGILVNDRPTLPKEKRHSVRGMLHRMYRMALDGVDQDEVQVDFSKDGPFDVRMKQLRGYIDGWTHKVAPDFYEKIRVKWETTKTIANTRERRTAS